jgi:hypothetical protein
LAQDANGLNYISLPFQTTCAMKTGVKVGNIFTYAKMEAAFAGPVKRIVRQV